jgi:hypothetical protein
MQLPSFHSDSATLQPTKGVLRATKITTDRDFTCQLLPGTGQQEIPAYSQRMDFSARPPAKRSPRGITAIGIFLVFEALMASLAGVTSVWRGTALDRTWTLNPRAFRELAPHGNVVGIPFLLLGGTLAIAGIGWFKCRLWGWPWRSLRRKFCGQPRSLHRILGSSQGTLLT